MTPQDFKHLRGRLTTHAPLGESLWFGAGGTADLVFRPEDEDDLAYFLSQYPNDAPLCVLGVGSNVIVRDGGVRGAIIRLGRGFNHMAHAGGIITAGAACLDLNLARYAADAGLAGLSFLSGIPGTLGGAVRMNAGAYQGETAHILDSVTIMSRDGTCQKQAADLDLQYRHSNLRDDEIVTRLVLRASGTDTPERLTAEIADIQARREASQPIRVKTGGSTFANPSAEDLARANLDPTTKTWQLIDAVGGRGLRCGGAMVSDKHCNFLINTGGATATDIEFLGEELRKRVYNRFGVDLRWEIRRVGDSLETVQPSALIEA